MQGHGNQAERKIGPLWCVGYATGTLPYYATGTLPVRYRIRYRRGQDGERLDDP